MKNAVKVICFVLAMLLAGVGSYYFAFEWDMDEFVFIDGAEKGTVIITDYIGSDKDIKIPKTLRGKKVVAIDSQAFSGEDITSVVIGDNVKSIGDNAFWKCENLVSVDLGDSVEKVGTMAFADCPLLAEIKFSPALKEIGNMLFRNNAKLTCIDPNGNANFKMVDGVLYSADMTILYETLFSADLSSYKLPETVKELKMMAFYGHEEIKSISLNSSIKHIPDGCFSMCSGMTELVIPEGVESVGKVVLVGSGITTVKIAKSVKSIDDLAFEHNEVTKKDENGNPVLDEFGKEIKVKEHEISIVTVEDASYVASFARRHEYPIQIVDAL